MRKLLTTITLLWFSNVSFGQAILSGIYDPGLKLAYDGMTNKLTGYYENYTGFDEETGYPRFSCIFYIQGTLSGSQFKVDTYYPNDTDETIKGEFQVIDQQTVSIKLAEEHGGCWNVQHFVDEQVKFSLEKQIGWTQIRFITSDKAYFHSDKSLNTRQKSYLVKNDFVCIEKMVDEWAYCTFYGKKITKGWIRATELNKI